MFSLLTTNRIHTVIYTTLIVSFPVYIWIRYLQKCKNVEKEYNNKVLHHKKHNCVVMYSKISGITGWPGFGENIYTLSIKDNYRTFEPLCYFITSAEKTLDIATMIISAEIIYKALISTAKSGVKLRLLLDFAYAKNNARLNELQKYGVEIYYVVTEATIKENMFHYKYAIKDYSDGSGYVCTSSINWTTNAFIHNYENIVFSTNKILVRAFHDNFEEALNYVKNVNKGDMKIKTKLLLNKFS